MSEYRNLEIIQASLESGEGVAFQHGALWADEHPSEDVIRRVAKAVAVWMNDNAGNTIPSAKTVMGLLGRKPTKDMLEELEICRQTLDMEYTGDMDDYVSMKLFVQGFSRNRPTGAISKNSNKC